MNKKYWLSITRWLTIKKVWKCLFIHLALKLQVENAVFKCSSKVKEAGQKIFVLPYDLPPRAYTKSGMYTLKSATDYLSQDTDKNMYTIKFCDFVKMF